MMNNNETLAGEDAQFFNVDDESVSSGTLGRDCVRHGVSRERRQSAANPGSLSGRCTSRAAVTVEADNDSSHGAAALSEQRDSGRPLVPSGVCASLALQCNIQQD